MITTPNHGILHVVYVIYPGKSFMQYTTIIFYRIVNKIVHSSCTFYILLNKASFIRLDTNNVIWKKYLQEHLHKLCNSHENPVSLENTDVLLLSLCKFICHETQLISFKTQNSHKSLNFNHLYSWHPIKWRTVRVCVHIH